MLLFWKLVDETQIIYSQKYTDTIEQNLTCIFLSVRANLKNPLCHGGPCIVKFSVKACLIFMKFIFIDNFSFLSDFPKRMKILNWWGVKVEQQCLTLNSNLKRLLICVMDSIVMAYFIHWLHLSFGKKSILASQSLQFPFSRSHSPVNNWMLPCCEQLFLVIEFFKLSVNFSSKTTRT